MFIFPAKEDNSKINFDELQLQLKVTTTVEYKKRLGTNSPQSL